MTSGVGVKPALIPFKGKAFHDGAAAAAPRNACAAAAPPGALTPHQAPTGLSWRSPSCVWDPPTPPAEWGVC